MEKVNIVTITMPTPNKLHLFDRGKTVVPSQKITIESDGSLHIDAISGSDAANYTCQAKNIHGTDQIVYAISVKGDCFKNTSSLCIWSNENVKPKYIYHYINDKTPEM